MLGIDMHEIAVTQNWIYGINYKYDVLCKICLSTHEVKEIQSLIINEEKLQYEYSTEFYRHILATETQIFIVNTVTNKLLIFNTDLQLAQELYLLEKAESMSIIGINNTALYIYAINSGIVLEVNLANGKIEKHQIPAKYIGKINSLEIKIIDDSIWLTGYIGNIILEISTGNGVIYEHQVNGIHGDICLCENFEDNLWLCTQHEIVEWDKQKNMIMQVFQLPFGGDRKDLLMPFYYSCTVNGGLYFFPLKGSKVLEIEKNRGDIVSYYIYPDRKQRKRQKTFSYLGNDNNAIIYGLDSSMNNIILKTSSGNVERINFSIEDTLFEEMRKIFYKHNFCLDERMFGISELLETTCESNFLNSGNDNNVGRKIYKYC
ncbi:MAG: hypothetical protein ACI4E5_00155 [Suilimivivens sp.]